MAGNAHRYIVANRCVRTLVEAARVLCRDPARLPDAVGDLLRTPLAAKKQHEYAAVQD